jgi:5'-3' exoribonuclease 2
MLSLATHEPHFKVLREDVFWKPDNAQGCRLCGQMGHIAADCRGACGGGGGVCCPTGG